MLNKSGNAIFRHPRRLAGGGVHKLGKITSLITKPVGDRGQLDVDDAQPPSGGRSGSCR